MENFLNVVSGDEQTDINRSSAISPFTVFFTAIPDWPLNTLIRHSTLACILNLSFPKSNETWQLLFGFGFAFRAILCPCSS
jgi:hypothetical protein